MDYQFKNYFEFGQKNILLIYILHIGFIIDPILAYLGGLLVYLNRPAIRSGQPGSWLDSHYHFAFRTFICCVIINIVSMLTYVILIGTFISILLIIWLLARSVVGIRYVLNEQPHPNPNTWLLD